MCISFCGGVYVIVLLLWRRWNYALLPFGNFNVLQMCILKRHTKKPLTAFVAISRFDSLFLLAFFPSLIPPLSHSCSYYFSFFFCFLCFPRFSFVIVTDVFFSFNFWFVRADVIIGVHNICNCCCCSILRELVVNANKIQFGTFTLCNFKLNISAKAS